MPVSQGASGGAVPGLGLRAWVLFNGATGAIISQMNVSGVVRGGVGSYAVTFANALGSNSYVSKVELTNAQPVSGFYSQMSVPAAAGFSISTTVNGSLGDPPGVYVAVYG